MSNDSRSSSQFPMVEEKAKGHLVSPSCCRKTKTQGFKTSAKTLGGKRGRSVDGFVCTENRNTTKEFVGLRRRKKQLDMRKKEVRKSSPGQSEKRVRKYVHRSFKAVSCQTVTLQRYAGRSQTKDVVVAVEGGCSGYMCTTQTP